MTKRQRLPLFMQIRATGTRQDAYAALLKAPFTLAHMDGQQTLNHQQLREWMKQDDTLLLEGPDTRQ